MSVFEKMERKNLLPKWSDSIMEFYATNREEVISPSRKENIREARQVIMHIMCRLNKMTLKEIGCIFGDRGHDTVIHSRDVIYDLQDVLPKFKAQINIWLHEAQMEEKNYTFTNNNTTK